MTQCRKCLSYWFKMTQKNFSVQLPKMIPYICLDFCILIFLPFIFLNFKIRVLIIFSYLIKTIVLNFFELYKRFSKIAPYSKKNESNIRKFEFFGIFKAWVSQIETHISSHINFGDWWVKLRQAWNRLDFWMLSKPGIYKQTETWTKTTRTYCWSSIINFMHS